MAFLVGMAAIERYTGTDHVSFVLRPDLNGVWFIQSDKSHRPIGVQKLEQNAGALVVHFTRNYPQVGSIQVSTDDGLGPWVSAHANLGVNSANIQIFANGVQIDPADIWDHVPPDSRANHNGNLWVDATMSKWPRL